MSHYEDHWVNNNQIGSFEKVQMLDSFVLHNTKIYQKKVLEILNSHLKQAYDDGEVQITRLISKIIKEVRDSDGV